MKCAPYSFFLNFKVLEISVENTGLILIKVNIKKFSSDTHHKLNLEANTLKTRQDFVTLYVYFLNC